jgi:hypothetical protein
MAIWSISRLFGYFMAFGCILWKFGVFFPNFISCIKKNLATLLFQILRTVEFVFEKKVVLVETSVENIFFISVLFISSFAFTFFSVDVIKRNLNFCSKAQLLFESSTFVRKLNFCSKAQLLFESSTFVRKPTNRQCVTSQQAQLNSKASEGLESQRYGPN